MTKVFDLQHARLPPSTMQLYSAVKQPKHGYPKQSSVLIRRRAGCRDVDQEMKHALQHQLETADLEQVLKNVWGSEADLNIVLTLFQGFQGFWFLVFGGGGPHFF